MEKFTYIITDPVGIHARPAGLLVKTAGKFEAAGTLETGGKAASLKSIIALMSLGVKKDAEVTVTFNGNDEKEAAAALKKVLEDNL